MFDETMFDTVPDGLVVSTYKALSLFSAFLVSDFADPPHFFPVDYTSSISYGEGLPMAPAETRDELGLMQDHLMVPIVAEEQFAPTREIPLNVWFDTFDDGSNRASMFDNITWVPPKTPSLMSMLSMGQDSLNPAVYGRQTAPQILNANEVIQLTVTNFDGNGHPFHLHGHKFQITRRQFPFSLPRRIYLVSGESS
jgi:iron transport multicopper oxidase